MDENHIRSWQGITQDLHLSVPRSLCSQPAAVDRFLERSKDETEMGKPSCQPLHPALHQYFVSSVKALRLLSLCFGGVSHSDAAIMAHKPDFKTNFLNWDCGGWRESAEVLALFHFFFF